MSINQNTIGARLKAFRKSKDINIVKFSELLGISHGSLSGLENNKSKPSADTLVNLCRNTDINIYWLFTGEGKMTRITREEDQNNEGRYLIEAILSLKRKIGTFFLDKLIQMIIFFANMCKLNKTKLNKLLFYGDFVHCRYYTNPITYIHYVKLLYGPAPDSYNAILGILQDFNVIEIEPVILDKKRGIVEERIRAKRVFNPDVFSDTELRVIRKIALELGDKTAGELSELSHQETFYQEIEVGKEIPYELAKHIKIKI